jgi:predicted O-methyltransferase YrrM
MSEVRWTEVDAYFTDRLGADDAALEAALAASDAAGLPKIAVSAAHGKWLHLMAQAIGARAVGPGGKVVTLEIDPRHAEVARGSIAKAGLADRVDIRIGPAIESLPKLAGEPPFDFSFIDADKESSADYFAWALKLSRPGALIIVDNVVREGKVVEPGSSSQVDGVRRLVDLIANEPRVSATVVQTVGVKKYDGMLVARVRG